MTRFLACATPEAAEWIEERVVSGIGAVANLVPSEFPAYVRFLHPFESNDHTDMSWSKLAGLSDLPFGRLMSSNDLIAASEEVIERDNIGNPIIGEIPPAGASLIARVLAAHTETPSHCSIAIWEGRGGAGPAPGVGAQFEMGSRFWNLYSGPLDSVGSGIEDMSGHFPIFPGLWWPADHRWFVGTEIDSRCTYVGCETDAAADLLDSGLEFVMADYRDPAYP